MGHKTEMLGWDIKRAMLKKKSSQTSINQSNLAKILPQQSERLIKLTSTCCSERWFYNVLHHRVYLVLHRVLWKTFFFTWLYILLFPDLSKGSANYAKPTNKHVIYNKHFPFTSLETCKTEWQEVTDSWTQRYSWAWSGVDLAPCCDVDYTAILHDSCMNCAHTGINNLQLIRS